MAGAAEGHAANWSFNVPLTASRSVSVPRGQGDGWIEHGERRRVRASDARPTSTDGRRSATTHGRSRRCCRFSNAWRTIATFPTPSFMAPEGRYRCRDPSADELHPLSNAFVAACRARLPRRDRQERARPPGCGRLPLNVIDGVRVNAAMAYISPNRNRVNLTIESGVTARRLVMNGAPGRWRRGRTFRFDRNRDGRRDRALCRRRHVAAPAVGLGHRPGSLIAAPRHRRDRRSAGCGHPLQRPPPGVRRLRDVGKLPACRRAESSRSGSTRSSMVPP